VSGDDPLTGLEDGCSKGGRLNFYFIKSFLSLFVRLFACIYSMQFLFSFILNLVIAVFSYLRQPLSDTMFIREVNPALTPNLPQSASSPTPWDPTTISNMVFGSIMVFVGMVAIWQGRRRRVIAVDGIVKLFFLQDQWHGLTVV
jgi:hypothetical protein